MSNDIHTKEIVMVLKALRGAFESLSSPVAQIDFNMQAITIYCGRKQYEQIKAIAANPDVMKYVTDVRGDVNVVLVDKDHYLKLEYDFVEMANMIDTIETAYMS